MVVRRGRAVISCSVNVGTRDVVANYCSGKRDGRRNRRHGSRAGARVSQVAGPGARK